MHSSHLAFYSSTAPVAQKRPFGIVFQNVPFGLDMARWTTTFVVSVIAGEIQQLSFTKLLLSSSERRSLLVLCYRNRKPCPPDIGDGFQICHLISLYLLEQGSSSPYCRSCSLHTLVGQTTASIYSAYYFHMEHLSLSH